MLTFAEIVDYINSEESNSEVLWKFQGIVSHEGPLRSTNKNYNGSKYNVIAEWENGEITPKPLSIIAAGDLVTCAIYAKESDLLDTPGWKQFKRLAKRAKKFLRAINQAKLRSYNRAPKFKHGFEVPRDYDTRWR